MRPTSTLLNETSLVRDRAMPMPTTPTNPVPMMTEPMHDRLVEPITATVAPELIVRARAILRAMKIQTTRRSSLDAQQA